MSTGTVNRPLAVVLSDVHIGTNVNTNWYQQKVHEGYLTATLDWVVRNAASIRELVLLGDLVDVWTYVPSAKPPSMSEIIAANPNVLGANGALARAVKAVPKVSLMLGNHDGTLTPADVETLSSEVGPISPVGPVYVSAGASGKKTVFAHGHVYTMFNRPDPSTSLSPLPVGHFVTRMIAHKAVTKLLKPGQTVADLHLWGQPSPGLSTIVNAITAGQNVAGVLLDLFALDAEFDQGAPIVLPNGEQLSINAAKATYASLLQNWLATWPLLDVVRAAMADYEGGEYLAWFAQRLALEQNADLVVMGHTHQPIGGLIASPVTYVNNGYQCAAIPDLASGAAAFTFTVVDLEAGTAAMRKVAPAETGGYAISEFTAPQIGVVKPPLRDFSCYVSITNTSGQELRRVANRGPFTVGRWVLEPPATLANGGTSWFWLQDEPGPYGTHGQASYDGGIRFDFACPYVYTDPNIAGGPGGDFIVRSGTEPWQPKGKVPPHGYPLQIKFTLSPADIQTFSGRCGENSFATAALGLQPGGQVRLNGSTELQNCIRANNRACVYAISLIEAQRREDYFEGIYRYRLSIDGQGPSGFGSGSMYLAFTDRTGDVYKKSFFTSNRHTLTLDYNSDSPGIVKIQWSNTAI